MDDYDEIIIGEHYVATIHRDADAENPLDTFEFVGKLYVPNCRYLRSTCGKDYFDSAVVVVPIYMYVHGGIAINTTGFHCKWDSGQVGYMCVSKGDALKAYNRKAFSRKLANQVRELLVSEIETIDQYFTGEVYGYCIHEKCDKDDEPPYEIVDCIDSCWGYYGLDWCKQNAKDALDYYDQKYKERNDD